MPPSSLIFVLIVAIWAAYLLQHWIRRRDHLATARSVDRFSEAMRVLERRKPLPQSALVTPEPRSYAVSPARPTRAEVLVKRAQPSVPAAARSGMAGTTGAARSSGSAGSVRLANPVVRFLSSLTAPRLRRLSLALAAGTVLLLVTLASLHVVRWWSVPVAFVVLALDLVWLRRAILADRRAHQAHAARVVQRVRSRRLDAAQLLEETAPVAPVAPVATRLIDPADLVDRADPLTLNPLLQQGEVAVGALSETGHDRGWQPVPVPPPTYTLKAKAPERPWVETAALTTTPSVPSASSSDARPFDRLAWGADEAGESEESVWAADGLAETGAGGAGLPFDGLALDEELEELPAVYAVG